jgi:hypothetical protein
LPFRTQAAADPHQPNLIDAGLLPMSRRGEHVSAVRRRDARRWTIDTDQPAASSGVQHWTAFLVDKTSETETRSRTSSTRQAKNKKDDVWSVQTTNRRTTAPNRSTCGSPPASRLPPLSSSAACFFCVLGARPSAHESAPSPPAAPLHTTSISHQHPRSGHPPTMRTGDSRIDRSLLGVFPARHPRLTGSIAQQKIPLPGSRTVVPPLLSSRLPSRPPSPPLVGPC